MSNLTLEQKALRVIEHLVSDDLCETASMRQHNKQGFSTKEANLMARKLGDIYMFSHAVNPTSCYSVHNNWRNVLIKLYNKMEKAGEFKHFSLHQKRNKIK